MKKLFNITKIAFFIAIVFSISSCGNKKFEPIKIKMEKNVKGDLADYIEVVGTDYEITESTLAIGDCADLEVKIKVKVIKKFEDADNISDIYIDFRSKDASGSDIESLSTNSSNSTSGPSYYDNNHDYQLKKDYLPKGEGEVTLTLDVHSWAKGDKDNYDKAIKDDVSKINTCYLHTSLSIYKSESFTEKTSYTDEDEFIVDYRKFSRNYISIIEKYKANPNDSKIAEKYKDFSKRAEKMEDFRISLFGASNIKEGIEEGAEVEKIQIAIIDAEKGL